ncbi:MAG TPA: dihydrofolate reductase family protein [Nitrospiria bacterium]|jgi:dihydrofolate reductase|nr:dihydrofolate reductase family protein [Nitrospiria bacterium]
MKTIVYIGTSLDGFIARKDGDLDWLVQFEKPVRDDYRKFIAKIDAVVTGRGTFEKALTFPSWPYDKKVFVLSKTIKHIPEKLRGKATVLSMKPRALLKYLSKEGFSNIYVDGGKVIQGFLKDDCIDEMIITRVPVLIGSGIPLFGDLDHDLPFRHVRTRVFSNGLVKSRYERIKASSGRRRADRARRR